MQYQVKIYYLFRFTLLLIFIFIAFSMLKSLVPTKLSNDAVPAITEHTETLLTSFEREPIYITSVVLIDPTFSNIEIGIIKNALDQWVFATNGIVDINYQVGYYPNHSIRITRPNTLLKIIRIKQGKETNPLIQRIDALLGAPIVGYADIENETNQDIITVYIMNERIDSIEEYSTVVQHEYAHIIGLLHLRDYSIMAPGENYASTCITLIDLKYFCYLYGCNPELLNPCDRAPLCNNDTFHLF